MAIIDQFQSIRTICIRCDVMTLDNFLLDLKSQLHFLSSARTNMEYQFIMKTIPIE